MDLGFKAGIWASRLEFGPLGWDDWASGQGFRPLGYDLGFKAGIWAARLGFGPQGWDLGLNTGTRASRLEFGPQGWELGLKAGIRVLRLGGGGWTKKEKVKIPHMCESIGH